MARTKGGVLLARTLKTQGEIAKTIGVSRMSVSKWIAGAGKPSMRKRGDLCAEYEIPEDAWDEPVTSSMRAPRVAAPVAEPTSARSSTSPPKATDMIDEVETLTREYIAEIRGLGLGVDPVKKGKCLASAAATLDKLDRWNGATFLKLPIWRRILDALRAGLDGHPDAAASVAREMRKVDEHFSW